MYTEDGIITNEAARIIDVTGKNAIGMARRRLAADKPWNY